MPARPALFVPAALAAVALLASLPASADTPPASPPLARPGVPLAPSLERRSSLAISGGAAAVTLGSVLLLSSALAGGLQAACDAHCDHTPTVIGMVSAGGVLLAAGIPLILWGGKLVPRGPLSAWVGAPARQGWAFRF